VNEEQTKKMELAKKVGAPQAVIEQADVLSPYYFRTRYPDAAQVDLDQQDIETVREATAEVMTWIHKQL